MFPKHKITEQSESEKLHHHGQSVYLSGSVLMMPPMTPLSRLNLEKGFCTNPLLLRGVYRVMVYRRRPSAPSRGEVRTNCIS